MERGALSPHIRLIILFFCDENLFECMWAGEDFHSSALARSETARFQLLPSRENSRFPDPFPRSNENLFFDVCWLFWIFVYVGGRGFEPPRDCSHWLLKPARLPIPPLAQLFTYAFSEFAAGLFGLVAKV